jgi:hypothetical protein
LTELGGIGWYENPLSLDRNNEIIGVAGGRTQGSGAIIRIRAKTVSRRISIFFRNFNFGYN